MNKTQAISKLSALALLALGVTSGAGETAAQQAATLPTSGTYSVTIRVEAATCAQEDAVGSEAAYTATVNSAGTSLRMTIPESGNWQVWAGGLHGNLLTLTSMQQASAVEHVPGQTWWQGVLYAQLNNAGPNVWSGSGTRIFMKRGRLCQSHLIMQMRRL